MPLRCLWATQPSVTSQYYLPGNNSFWKIPNRYSGDQGRGGEQGGMFYSLSWYSYHYQSINTGLCFQKEERAENKEEGGERRRERRRRSCLLEHSGSLCAPPQQPGLSFSFSSSNQAAPGPWDRNTTGRGGDIADEITWPLWFLYSWCYM